MTHKSRDPNIKEYLANFVEIFANGVEDKKVGIKQQVTFKARKREKSLLLQKGSKRHCVCIWL